MARSLTNEQLARLPECRPLTAAGGSDRDLQDCAIRALRDLSPAAAWAALGLDPAGGDVVLTGGSGRLELTAGRIDYAPAPTLAGMAAGVTGAALTALRRAVAGEPVLASPDIVAARLQTCAECVHYLAPERRCGACRCFTEAKVRLAGSYCPLSHWD